GFGRQHGGHAGHAGDLLHHLLGRLAQRLELLGSLERYGDREIDAPVLDEDFRNETQIDDIAFEIRSLYTPELLQHLILRYGHALSPSKLVAGVDSFPGGQFAYVHRPRGSCVAGSRSMPPLYTPQRGRSTV